MKAEAALAEQDPEVDMKELTTHIYVDNANRTYLFS